MRSILAQFVPVYVHFESLRVWRRWYPMSAAGSTQAAAAEREKERERE